MKKAIVEFEDEYALKQALHAPEMALILSDIYITARNILNKRPHTTNDLIEALELIKAIAAKEVFREE